MTTADALALIAGYVLIVIGVALLSVPAAVITAGVLMLVGAVWPKRPNQSLKETQCRHGAPRAFFRWTRSAGKGVRRSCPS